MKKDDEDKIKKLMEEIKTISEKIDKISCLGKIKDINKAGHSAHIIIDKKFIGRKALVIVFPEIDGI